jgi:hypothetical protein
MNRGIMKFFTWDLETFPNCFLNSGKFYDSPEIYTFEVSFRKDQRRELLSHLSYLQNLGVHMVGFNNLGFDYNILHYILNNPHTFDAASVYIEAQKIFDSQKNRFGGGGNLNQIWQSDRILNQIDLMKIHHFDNGAKATSLKALQFAMRSESVEDLPIAVGEYLTSEQIDQLIKYNHHDVLETEKFLEHTLPHIKIRQELLDTKILTGDVLNFSDVKIGTEYLVTRIGKQKCKNGNKPKQTFRTEIPFKSIILPKIWFRTEPFQKVLDWFKSQTYWVNSDTTPKLEVPLANLQFDFGVGGVHASVKNKYFESTETHVIKDIDVSGMYVAVAIANGFYPEHLGQDFVTAYKQLQSDRAQFKKGTVMNFILKLAGNGVFGNSNNVYSPFYDPKYTFSVTVNGQLQLLQLVEPLSLIPGLEIIQANTDGVTARMPREMGYLFELWKADWEQQTGLKLEEVEYSRMWIADVNNYMAIDTKGNVKRKGKYWYPLSEADMWGSSGSNWNKDYSNLTAQKGIEQVLINGHRPEDVIRLLTDPFDFMMRYKTPGGAVVYVGDRPQLKTVRYYVSTRGEPMKKISKPKGEMGSWKRKNSLTDEYFNKIKAEVGDNWDARIHTQNKSKNIDRVQSIESGRLVKVCNVASDFNWADVDYDYYITEMKKLYIGEKNV